MCSTVVFHVSGTKIQIGDGYEGPVDLVVNLDVIEATLCDPFYVFFSGFM